MFDFSEIFLLKIYDLIARQGVGRDYCRCSFHCCCHDVSHMAVLAATDFFTVEVLTLKGLMTYYVLFFMHLESRRICLAGITRHPDQEWMEQMGRNVTMEANGFLANCRY